MSFNPGLLIASTVAEFNTVYTKDASFGMILNIVLVQCLGVTEILSYTRKRTNGTHQVFLTRARGGRINLIAVHRDNDPDFILAPSDERFRDNFIMDSQPQHLYARDSANESYKLLRFSTYLWLFFFYGSLIASFVKLTTDYFSSKIPFEFLTVLSLLVWHLSNVYSVRAYDYYVRTLNEFETQDREWFREERLLQNSRFTKGDFEKFSKSLVCDV